MLGQQVLRTFTDGPGLAGAKVIATSRNPKQPNFVKFSFPETSLEELVEGCDVGDGDYVLNCAGWIPQRNNASNPLDRAAATQINSILPMLLSEISQDRDIRVISIGTDCVFSGRDEGPYSETSPQNPIDFYGATKALGEMYPSEQMVIRTSIIGESTRTSSGLFEWFRSQPMDAVIEGYTNHFWNGTSTHFFSRVLKGVVEFDSYSPGVQHLVPADSCSKAELLQLFQNKLGRNDVQILQREAPSSVRRVLTTSNPERNRDLWNLAGFQEIPTISEAVDSI